MNGLPQVIILELAQRVGALARIAYSKLEALNPASPEEIYLAQAQNHADLERRMFELQYPQDSSSSRY